MIVVWLGCGNGRKKNSGRIKINNNTLGSDVTHTHIHTFTIKSPQAAATEAKVQSVQELGKAMASLAALGSSPDSVMNAVKEFTVRGLCVVCCGGDWFVDGGATIPFPCPLTRPPAYTHPSIHQPHEPTNRRGTRRPTRSWPRCCKSSTTAGGPR